MANLTNSAKLINEMERKVNSSDLSAVATSGSYTDLSNKPTIPAAQVQTDWNAVSGMGVLLNKPALATVATSGSYNDLINLPSIPVNAGDIGALSNTTKYGASLDLTMDSSTYVVTVQLKDQDGNNLGAAKTIDLPLESVVVSGSYDNNTKKVVLTLKDGSTVDFSVADLVSGLQSEITSTNKLDADLVNDTSSTHKFVTANEKATWGGKQDKATSGNGAPSTAPSYIGQEYIDTTNNHLYVATGTSSSSDWYLVGENTGVEVRVLSQSEYDILTAEEKNAEVIYLITGGTSTNQPLVYGSNGVNYVINVSTTAPATGTANNIITIVTD